MIELTITANAVARMQGPGFRIRRPVDDAGEARLDACARAHDAGFQGNKEPAAGQAVVAGPGGGRADYRHLGMAAGIMRLNAVVARFGQDAVVAVHQYRAHRHFTRKRSFLCHNQGAAHEDVINL